MSQMQNIQDGGTNPSCTDDLSIYVGKEVRIKKNQGRLGGDKYPGRFGTVVKPHPFMVPEPLFYVSLKPTARAKERIDTFWFSDLIFINEELNTQPEPAKGTRCVPYN